MITQERFDELVKLAGNKLEDCEAIKKAVEESLTARWTSAATPPDSDLTVLVFTPNGGEPIRPGFHDGEVWCDYNGAGLTGEDSVTHWVPLPDPPLV